MIYKDRKKIKQFKLTQPSTKGIVNKNNRQGYIKPIDDRTHRSKTMKELVVFTNTGNNYYFENVENLKPTTNGFKFDYTGMATGKKRTATFDNTSTAGYTLADM